MDENAKAVLAAWDTLPDSARVRVRVVAAHEGCSDKTIWPWVRLGLYPKPHRNAGVTSWSVGDIRQHHRDRSGEVA